MTAAVADGRGGLRAARVARPRPGPGEALLRLTCAGLCGTDLWKLRQGLAPPGTVLGHEVVGIIEELGERPGSLPGSAARTAGAEAPGRHPAVGDRVVVVHHVACGACRFCRAGSETQCAAFREQQLLPGGFGERLVVRAAALEAGSFRLPRRLADEAALFLEPLACVLRGLGRAGIAPERTGSPEGPAVVVQGAGGMGLLHLLALRAVAGPALTLLAAEPLAGRRALALRLGADGAAAPGAALHGEVLARTAGRGADVVFDTVGGARALAQALALGRPGGTVVLFAHAPAGTAGDGADGEPAGFPLNAFFKAERRLIATYSSARAEQRAAWRLLASGRVDPRPLVTHRLPLERADEAVALAGDRAALKILLVPGSGGAPRGAGGMTGGSGASGGGA